MQLVLTLFQPFGVDLFCLGKKFLVFNLVSRNLKVKYRRSILGVLWTLLSPLATAAVYYFVFKVILKVQAPHYLVFIVTGVLFWNFFLQTTIEGMESIVGNFGLVSKVPIPLQIFPYTGAITNLVTLVLAIPVVLLSAVLSHSPIGFQVLALFFFTGCLFMISYGIAYVLAMAFVPFRDLRHIMSIVMQMWFYGTPVIYDSSMIPAKFRWVLYANPIGTTFDGLQAVMVQGHWPTATQTLVTLAWTIAAVIITALCHRKFTRNIVERI